MLTRADALALLKVLIAASWADSRLSQAEMNYVKSLAQHLRLAHADWAELEPYLEDAPSETEVDSLFRDLLDRLGSRGAREEVIRHLQEILSADAQMSAEEHDFLEQYSFILREASTVELLTGRMKSLFQRRPRGAVLDLEEFIRNKILFKVRRRVGSREITPELHRTCLIGGLMGIVARADGEIDGRELEEIRSRLESCGRFTPEVMDVLMAVVNEESVRGLDRSRILAELSQDITFEQKIDLLDLLFAVASANGSLTHLELEELRGISAGLNLSHRQYIDAKLRSRTTPLPRSSS
jgi:uncharacterized tellurite resistance protein B-like protein